MKEMLMNNKIRTLLIDDDEKIINDVKKYFSSSTVVDVTLIERNGISGLDIATQKVDNIDLVIMDNVLPEKDGLSLLKEFKARNLNFKVILTCSVKNTIMFDNLEDYNVDYVFLKPYDLGDLENVIEDIFNYKGERRENSAIEAKITKMLHSLGIPSHIKGYQYIRESILLIYRNPYIIGGITKELYPEVATRFKTTPSRVERAIRHAIEVSWNRGDYEYMEELFGHSVDYDRAKPTNSEFIATVADKLRLDINTYSR